MGESATGMRNSRPSSQEALCNSKRRKSPPERAGKAMLQYLQPTAGEPKLPCSTKGYTLNTSVLPNPKPCSRPSISNPTMLLQHKPGETHSQSNTFRVQDLELKFGSKELAQKLQHLCG